MKMKYVILSLLLVIVFYALVYRRPRTGIPVLFILPDGFRGVFVIKHDRVNGDTPKVIDSKIHITVPPTGIVTMNSVDFFREFHQEFCETKSGKEIPNGHLPSSKPDEIALYGLGNIGFGGKPAADYFLIGNRAEFDEWIKTRQLPQRPDISQDR